MRELSDEAARRVGQLRQPLRQIGARGEFGVRDQTGQDTIKQIDVIGAEGRGALQKKFADPARSVGASFGVAAPDDFIEFRGSAWSLLS